MTTTLSFAAWLIFAVAIVLLSYVPYAERLRVLVAHSQGSLRLTEAIRMQVVVLFVNAWTPGRLGYAIKIGWLKKSANVPLALGVTISAAEIMLELGAVAFLAGVAVLIHPEIFLETVLSVTTRLVTAVPVAGIAAVAAFTFGILWLFREPISRKLSRTGHLRKHIQNVALISPSALTAGATYSVVLGLSHGLVLFALLRALGESVPLVTTILIAVMGIAIGVISLSPGGLVTREAATLLFLTAIGVDSMASVTAMALWRALTTLLPSVLGLLFVLTSARDVWANRRQLAAEGPGA